MMTVNKRIDVHQVGCWYLAFCVFSVAFGRKGRVEKQLGPKMSVFAIMFAWVMALWALRSLRRYQYAVCVLSWMVCISVRSIYLLRYRAPGNIYKDNTAVVVILHCHT